MENPVAWRVKGNKEREREWDYEGVSFHGNCAFGKEGEGDSRGKM